MLVFPAGATAKKAKKKSDRGTLIYGKGKYLLRVKIGDGKPVKVAKLGFAAKRIDSLVADKDGRSIMVTTKENHYWVVPEAKPVKDLPAVRHVCRGKAEMSRDGAWVLCLGADGATLNSTAEGGAKKPIKLGKGAMATFAGDKVDEVVVVNANGIQAISVATGKARSLGVLSPKSDLLIAPDGKRAVAVFDDGDKGDGLYGFLLDGKGVRRKLGIGSVPVAWSQDSKWLAVTRKKRGCVIRAAGGQYRCFNGFRALGISPDHKDAFLATGSPGSLRLFRADLGGARSSTPSVLLSGAQGAAVWLAP